MRSREQQNQRLTLPVSFCFDQSMKSTVFIEPKPLVMTTRVYPLILFYLMLRMNIDEDKSVYTTNVYITFKYLTKLKTFVFGSFLNYLHRLNVKC